MKKFLLLFISASLFMACSSVKKTQKALNYGNYQSAMNTAITNLVKNKSKKGNQPYVLMLEEAFAKNAERQLDQIAFLKKDNNPANFEEIYNTYNQLNDIQEQIKPLLPLQVYKKNRNAKFAFTDYDNEILAVKNDLSQHLYANASNLLQNATTKLDYRKSYDDLVYLDEISPGYKDVKTKIEEAHNKGLDFVRVVMINDSDKIVPRRLEDELLNFNTYGLNDLWTRYHSNAINTVDYDYEMQVAFTNIDITPEQVSEKQIIKEKQIKDGYKYVYDRNDNVVKDSLGNKIKVDKFKTVKCSYYQFTQFKAAKVNGKVAYFDLKKQQQIDSYPITSEFIFEHIYANYDGDKRALDNDLISLLKLGAVPFPDNEQMVYDAGEDIKARLKNIITGQKFASNTTRTTR